MKKRDFYLSLRWKHFYVRLSNMEHSIYGAYVFQLKYPQSLFLCLLRCKFWLESGAVQSYNNRVKSNRLSSKCERWGERTILREFLLTTQQTTYRFGADGNSGDKSAKERGFPGGKGRKKLFLAESAFIGPFGSRMPQVRIMSLDFLCFFWRAGILPALLCYAGIYSTATPCLVSET